MDEKLAGDEALELLRERLNSKHAPIRSYQVTEWSTHCQECGGEIASGYRSASAAREAFDNLVAREGKALCDQHWVEPDLASGVG